LDSLVPDQIYLVDLILKEGGKLSGKKFIAESYQKTSLPL
jgi:hypothetical protein